ncbi:MAG: hypothetical protein J6K01_00820 [Paludibacteraceae bacterium]|nr:hypothetical protein [Paludibacteraceae bacterium]
MDQCWYGKDARSASDDVLRTRSSSGIAPAALRQGAWEDDLLAGTRELEAVLREKNIPAWIDYWGKDVSHDWVWWQRQIVYFFDKILPWK